MSASVDTCLTKAIEKGVMMMPKYNECPGHFSLPSAAAATITYTQRAQKIIAAFSSKKSLVMHYYLKEVELPRY